MNIKEKVPNLELCKELWKLGITDDFKTERIWARLWHLAKRHPEKEYVLINRDYEKHNIHMGIPAPDLSELLGILPVGSTLAKVKMGYLGEYYPDTPESENNNFTIRADTALDVVAKTLIKN